MAVTMSGVDRVKELIDAARLTHGRLSLQRLAADIGLNSQQHLSHR